MLLFLQFVFGLLQLLLDLLHVFVHLSDGRVQDLPDEKSKWGTESLSVYREDAALASWELKPKHLRVPPGELMGHVLREEPVGDCSTVHNLRPNQFVHQHGDHLPISRVYMNHKKEKEKMNWLHLHARGCRTVCCTCGWFLHTSYNTLRRCSFPSSLLARVFRISWNLKAIRRRWGQQLSSHCMCIQSIKN